MLLIFTKNILIKSGYKEKVSNIMDVLSGAIY
ncbi:hypothetical protein ME9_01204 [Bartonella taylorii 8TBB]|uniref:Uncharacterized protein n=1 Tax=Bartonella taylorii 8TBB TaxID=1094560 RepID=A0A9P2RZG9_BARTA|nr:hypothetical protein ME9_01204 [Bartonella taylorii 8TBB]